MEQKDYRLAAIMYTDISGFSRMMEKDETATLQLLQFHNALISEVAAAHHGTVIKTIGDAFLVDFKNTVEALQSALEIQDKLWAYNKEHPTLPLLVRIGIHLGDIYFFENDALGEGINIAARLQGIAHPGCICFSQDVYNQVINKLDFTATKLGKVSLKNITKEVHAFEISSANVEFDPKRDLPKPGYEPGSYLGKQEGAAPPAAPERPSLETTERTYDAAGSKDLITRIRRAILEDVKREGRRLTVEEVRAHYRDYGVEAEEVIAALADQGILQRKRNLPSALASEGTVKAVIRQADSGDLGKNIEAAVETFIGAIESGARHIEGRAHARKKSQKELIREKYKQHERDVPTGKWDSKIRESDHFKPGAEEILDDFESYRSAALMRATKQRTGFFGSLFGALTATGICAFINIFFAIGFPFAAIVGAATGIGVMTAYAAARRAKRKTKELEAMPPLEPSQIELYKKANRVKDSFALHSAQTIGVPFLLAVINYVTYAGFPWAGIVAIVMVASWISHFLAYRLTKPRVEKDFLRSVGHEGSWWGFFRSGKRAAKAGASLGRYSEYYKTASSVRDAIVSQIHADGKKSPLEKEVIPSLDSYVGQVLLLSQTVNEIDGIISAIPMADLRHDKAALVEKVGQTGNQALKAEYQNSIAEIDKQETSYKDLEDRREMLELRLKSSVNQLKQMQLDLARFRSSPEANEDAALEDVKRKTSELTKYIEDLRQSYEETHVDPFAELEELARKEEERKKLAADGQKGQTSN
jgi:class 3 adenylate cyclase